MACEVGRSGKGVGRERRCFEFGDCLGRGWLVREARRA